MKLLVFAHTPPPHHGQSYMVQLMLEGLTRGCLNLPARELGIQCYHVNARVSKDLGDIGEFHIGKLLLLVWYCLQAVWCRYRYGVQALYYVPAPGKRSALYRDWLVMFLCRPFFPRVILHWHAAGLGKWLETSVPLRMRSLTYRMMRQADLSIVLSQYNRHDAEKLLSRNIRVVNNGIPDPCPDFDRQLLQRRRTRCLTRQTIMSKGIWPRTTSKHEVDANIVRVLYLAHCTREKGLFDALSGVILVNQAMIERRSPLVFRLVVAGNFVSPEEKNKFEAAVGENEAEGLVQYEGFVSGERKHVLLREADLFLFPTYYQNENQPVNLIEAMAYGLPILTTRWRSIPELLPAAYAGLVEIRDPAAIAHRLELLASTESGETFRQTFLQKFTLEKHLSCLADAIRSIETQPADRESAASV